MTKENNEIEKVETALTSEELVKMSDRLADSYRTLELMISALNLVRSPGEINESNRNSFETHYYSVHELTSNMFSTLQYTVKNIEDIGYILMENANAAEIEEARSKLI